MSNSEKENRRDHLVHAWQNRYRLQQSILREPIDPVFMDQYAEFMADLDRGPDLGTEPRADSNYDKPGDV